MAVIKLMPQVTNILSATLVVYQIGSAILLYRDRMVSIFQILMISGVTPTSDKFRTWTLYCDLRHFG